jgi:putative membrane protein
MNKAYVSKTYMNTWQHRAPAAFRLDRDGAMVRLNTETGGASGQALQLQAEPDFDAEIVMLRDLPRSSRRRVRWGALFLSALGGLVLLAAGMAVSSLIADLFQYNRGLGWLGLALAGLGALSLMAVAIRETMGLLRLATVEKLRDRAATMIVSDDRVEARALVHQFLHLTRRMPHLARSRANLQSHLAEIIDGADLVRLAERELMTSLDQQARTIIATAATRVSVVTALSPRAVIDVLYVLASALALLRQLAFLYGVRPGTVGLVRLARLVVVHLGITGGLASSDSLIQQLLGHGIAAKLSARLGEGVLNGLVTARFGLAALDVIRPMPFAALSRPTLRDIMNELLRSLGDRADDQQCSPQSDADHDESPLISVP